MIPSLMIIDHDHHPCQHGTRGERSTVCLCGRGEGPLHIYIRLWINIETLSLNIMDSFTCSLLRWSTSGAVGSRPPTLRTLSPMSSPGFSSPTRSILVQYVVKLKEIALSFLHMLTFFLLHLSQHEEPDSHCNGSTLWRRPPQLWCQVPPTTHLPHTSFTGASNSFSHSP